MLQALKQKLLAQTTQGGSNVALTVFCSINYVVYNWARLGLFTGSRISEYGQAKVQKGQWFATIPKTHNANQWAEWSITFIAANFFNDIKMIKIQHGNCLTPTKAINIHEVRVWFRFDKNTTNFSIRKYRQVLTAPFDPVDPAINIVKQPIILAIPPNKTSWTTQPSQKQTDSISPSMYSGLPHL